MHSPLHLVAYVLHMGGEGGGEGGGGDGGGAGGGEGGGHWYERA